MNYTFAEGDDIVIPIAAKSGPIPDGMTLSFQMVRKGGGRIAESFATRHIFTTEFRAETGSSPALWLASLTGSDAAEVKPGRYTGDALIMIGGSKIHTSQVSINIKPSIAR